MLTTTINKTQKERKEHSTDLIHLFFCFVLSYSILFYFIFSFPLSFWLVSNLHEHTHITNPIPILPTHQLSCLLIKYFLNSLSLLKTDNSSRTHPINQDFFFFSLFCFVLLIFFLFFIFRVVFFFFFFDIVVFFREALLNS